MYVTHLHRQEWGVGKVLEGTAGTALRLWFELGGERKIGVDYHGMLQEAAAPMSFQVPTVTSTPPKKQALDKFHREYYAGRWEFTFSSHERARFKSGHLVQLWAERYPFLFDAEDVEQALAPPAKGSKILFAWAAAVRLYEARGYYSLLKYSSSVNPRKVELLSKLVAEGVIDEASPKAPVPDLLVYTPDLSESFFCAIKGPGDVVRKTEDTAFPSLSERTKKPIYLVTLSLH